MKASLGVDTSNYTTSAALYYDNGRVIQKKKMLPVKGGERGLRQSDAVFHHTVALPSVIEELFDEAEKCEIVAIGVSAFPTTEKNSYMPCFLVGECVSRSISAQSDIPLYRFSHQQGHIAAALYSASRLDLINERFIAFHVSGGTTDAVLCEPDERIAFHVTPLASSNDLKAGQAVDRIGVKLGLPFPCGKYMEELALKSERTFSNTIKLYNGDCSLSGLENKCLKMIESGEKDEDTAKYLLTYIADAVSEMADNVLNEYGALPLVFAGGVMSDSIIRNIIESRFEAFFASPEFSCDNAAGTAILAYKEVTK